jgi:predicted dehydrogenase
MPRPIKLGIVGCGVVCQHRYMPVLLEESRKGKVALVAACDTSPERATLMHDKYGFKEVYTDFGRMLASSDVEVVAILTPIHLHYAQTKAALLAGKHTYVQKPLATRLCEADELVSIARSKGLKLSVAPGMMLEAECRAARDMIRKGKIGKVCFVRALAGHPGHESPRAFDYAYGIDPTWYYQPDAGPLRDVAVYPLHVITGILGPAKRVAALSGIAIPERQWKGKVIPVRTPDNIQLVLGFGDGTLAQICASFCMVASNVPMIEFYGTDGVIYLGMWTWQGRSLELYTSGEVVGYPGGGWQTPSVKDAGDPGIARDLLHLFDCVRDGKDPISSGEHARHVVEIIEKAYESISSGRVQEIASTF